MLWAALLNVVLHYHGLFGRLVWSWLNRGLALGTFPPGALVARPYVTMPLHHAAASLHTETSSSEARVEFERGRSLAAECTQPKWQRWSYTPPAMEDT